LQAVTPTANRTISFPDATGTVALVSGADGTVQYNEAGVLKGNSDFTVDPDWNNASTVFTGLKLNVTDTASAAGSKLVDIQSNGTSDVVIDSDGRLLVGTSSAYSGVNGQLLHTAAAGALKYAGLAITTFSSSTGDGAGSIITLDKSNNDTLGTNTAVTNNDQLGIIAFRGADGGSNFRDAAYIQCFVDGTVSGGGAADMPGRLVFSTTADGAGSPTERMRVTSDGYLRLAAGTGGIQFGGDTAAANALDDYEEGSSTVTYTTTGGVFSHGGDRLIYTKIGNTVYCRMAIAAATTGGSLTPGTGEIIITGLPFVVQASGGANSSFVASAALGVVHQGISNSFNTQPFCVVPISGTSTLKLKASGSTSAYMDATAFASTTNTQYNWISTEFWYNV